MKLHIAVANRVIEWLRQQSFTLLPEQVDEYNQWFVNAAAEVVEGLHPDSQCAVLWDRTEEGLVYFYLVDGVKPKFVDVEFTSVA